MASINKRGEGQWQVKVRKKGYKTISKTLPTKSKAEQWARLVESEMDRGIFMSTTEAETILLSELLDQYEKEIAPTKKSENHIKYTLKFLNKSLGHLTLAAITPGTVKEFRDYRLETVSNDTSRKELLLLGRVLKVAQKEWDIYLPRGNPVDSISIPSKGKARDRRLEFGEEEQLLRYAEEYGGYIKVIIQLAIETGARRSELGEMRWENIKLSNRTATFLDTKNGDDRTIPLSSKAIEIFKSFPRKITGDVFSIRSDSITQAFGRICKLADIEDLRFHDLRHEATSRFFEMGLSIMEVSSITGHKDLAMLKRYTHLKAEDLAQKLK